MARLDKGNNLTSAIAQPGRTITENADGSIEGSVTWMVDESGVNSLPEVSTGAGKGDKPGLHPDDNRLECYERTIAYGANGIVTCVASYFGLWEKNRQVVEFTGGVNTDPIQTHPKFETSLGGSAASPLNGAKFSDNDEFLGFSEFISGNTNLNGVESYLTPATNVTISYWIDSTPIPKRLGTVTPSITGVTEFRKPQGVKDFLLIDQSYRQVGNFFQVSESYLGSGEKGWNKKIYDAT